MMLTAYLKFLKKVCRTVSEMAVPVCVLTNWSLV